MPKHVRSIECCYCSASTLVNLREVNEKSLKCGECGAGMAVDKMEHVSQPVEVKSKPSEHPQRQTPERKEKREWRDDDKKKRSKPKKKKKKKGLFDRLEDIWDDVEDIFD